MIDNYIGIRKERPSLGYRSTNDYTLVGHLLMENSVSERVLLCLLQNLLVVVQY